MSKPTSRYLAPKEMQSIPSSTQTEKLLALSLQTHLAITKLLGHPLYINANIQTTIDEMLEAFKYLSPEED